jgi:hypothetical protein
MSSGRGEPQLLRLKSICRLFLCHPYRLKALKLVYRFFPEEMNIVLTESDWLEVMTHFFRLIRIQNWFEIDEEAFDDVVHQAFNRQHEPIVHHFDLPPREIEWLAAPLTYIPVRCYGFNEVGWRHNLQAHPPFELLRLLLKPSPRQPSLRLRALLKIEPAAFLWPESRRITVIHRLQAIPATDLPGPLQALPEAIPYACGCTHNFLLDHAPAFNDWKPGWFRWDNALDLNFLQQQWQQAQPVLQRVRHFEQLFQGPAELNYLFSFLRSFHD